jgi:endonuclease/exonuclease/phosphatase family metal-dependent hydrolase
LLLLPLRFVGAFVLALLLLGFAQSASAQTVVLYASQAPVKVGNWTTVSDSTAAGGVRLANSDKGASKIATAASSPSSYVEFSFFANAGQPYRVWMRGKAAGDSPYNDSVHIQFSGSINFSGTAVYRIGTTSSTEYNLEDCLACGVQGWGWQDNGWGILGPTIFFQSTGTQTIRIQPREDGLSLDQIVISSSTYLYTPPGAGKNDSVILTQTGGAPAPAPTPTPTPTPAPTPNPAPTPAPANTSDVVIWASNVNSVFGSWQKEANSTAAGQVSLRHSDSGAGKLSTALSSPSNYFEVSFNATAGQPYRLWVRGKGDSDYWANDSVFVQFSGSLNALGGSAYRIGTTSAVEVNLEDCSGCGIQGWGWQDDGWGSGVLGPVVFFQSTGTQTIRVQTREDGLSIDQIVLSPQRYLFSGPGALKNDGVILASTLGAGSPPPPPTPNQPPQLSISASPTSGTSPLFVSFSSSASDPDGFIASYFWNFGDNSTSSSANPTHTYSSAGSFLAYLTVTDNSGAATTKNVTINVSAPAAATAQVKVLSWNVSFGIGTDGVTNWNRIATYIANFNPDLVALCEMPPDDIGTLVSLLNQKTGRSWSSSFKAKFSGYPEGNLILSKHGFVSTSSRYMSYERSVAQATVSIGGRTVNFFATHLDHTSSSLRYQQVTELHSFTSGFSGPKIVGGDFNAGPDLSEAIHMAEQFSDSWVQAMNIGTASAYADNPVYMHTRTRRGRIDYVWTSGNIVIKSAQIPDVRDLNNTNVVTWLGTSDDRGVRPSDHNPAIAIVEIR